eukprot:TRINITY_DN23569_c0_g2_i6.p1 TRINITY_DN23569_c0_g2~~TRINITY_DN23569_c0_g2_i6.p1  ORF type:complete len:184 (+),score=19.81 TRINITY_DN23569_c0_g2_i6:268-819(+)
MRPSITIQHYMQRIAKYSGCSDACYILCFVYIDRLIQKNPGMLLTHRNVHRTILAAMVVAIKFHDDQYFDNVFYSQLGGVTLGELNFLEVQMLFLLRFNLVVDTETFAHYSHVLSSHYSQILATTQENPVRAPVEDMADVRSVGPETTQCLGNRSYPYFPNACLLYTSPSPRDLSTSRMPSSA